MVKNWLIEIDKQTANKFVMIKQVNENLKICVNDIDIITHKMISDLRGNIVFSAAGYEICDYNGSLKNFTFKII